MSILPLARSLGVNGIRDEGVTAIAAVLKETKITTLECAAAPEEVFARVSAPIDTPTLSPFPIPLPRSLWGNGIGAEGVSALGAILNETKITELKCAPVPEVFAFVSAPIDTRLLSPFPSCPSLPGSEATGLETRPKRRVKTLRAAASASAFSKRPRCATPEFGGGGCRRLGAGGGSLGGPNGAACKTRCVCGVEVLWRKQFSL